MVLVSICIPTYKRPEIVKETILSIFTQNVDDSLFDVCITDNSPTDETKDMIEKELPKIKNLHYKKVACEGFMNSIEALKYGDGKFLKLHNDYSKFLPGSLQKMIDSVNKFQKDSVVFFGMNEKGLPEGFSEYNSFDEFMNAIHYWSTWSSAFAIWKIDFDSIMEKNIELDRMFPHTSVLFDMTEKSKYYVDNYGYVENLNLKKKGGYNLVDNFVRLYLGMVKTLFDNKRISTETYEKIKAGILQFVAGWYVDVSLNPDVYSFSFDNWKEKVEAFYGKDGVKYIQKQYNKKRFKIFVKKLIKGKQGVIK